MAVDLCSSLHSVGDAFFGEWGVSKLEWCPNQQENEKGLENLLIFAFLVHLEGTK